jgi:hypothetical protein
MSSGAWGGATKVYTASREMYDTVVNECPEIFPRMVDAFHLSVAIGLASGRRKSFERKPPEILNMYSVDQEEVIAPLLASLHPDASATDRYTMLQEFAEHGIEVIYDEVRATASFDPTPYLFDDVE